MVGREGTSSLNYGPDTGVSKLLVSQRKEQRLHPYLVINEEYGSKLKAREENHHAIHGNSDIQATA